MKGFMLVGLFFILIAAMLPVSLRAQHHDGHHSEEQHLDKDFWRMSIFMGHTYLPTNTSMGRELLVLPSMGLDIEYWFNHNWGIGLHNDLELLTFEIEREEDVFVDREYPALITLDLLWHPQWGLVFYAGPGIEIERNENFFVFRAGVEYEISLGEVWDFYPSVFYDYREDAYDTFTLGLGFGRKF